MAVGLGAVAVAAAPTTFTAGETLTAADLNANFADLDARVTALEAPPTKILASGTAGQAGVFSTDTVYTSADLALPAGTWLVVGNAILETSFADLDGLGLYDATNGVAIPDSLGDVRGIDPNTQRESFTTVQVVTVASSTTIELDAVRHGASTVSFADMTANGGPTATNAHKLTAWRLR
jgi:hypothetical protein